MRGLSRFRSYVNRAVPSLAKRSVAGESRVTLVFKPTVTECRLQETAIPSKTWVGRGSRKVQRFARASRRTPKRQMYYAFEPAEPRLCAGPRLGGSVGLATYSAIGMPIISRNRFGLSGASPHQIFEREHDEIAVALLSCFTPALFPRSSFAADKFPARFGSRSISDSSC